MKGAFEQMKKESFRKPNIASIGCGHWGTNLVNNLSRLGVLHAVCDTSSEILKDIKSKYPSALAKSYFKDLLGSEEIDGVVLATPAGTHYPMAKKPWKPAKMCLSKNLWPLPPTKASNWLNLPK